MARKYSIIRRDVCQEYKGRTKCQVMYLKKHGFTQSSSKWYKSKQPVDTHKIFRQEMMACLSEHHQEGGKEEDQ